MLLATDTWKVCFNIYENPSEIQCPPTLVLIWGIIYFRIPPSAYRAFPLQSLSQMDFNQNAQFFVLVAEKLNVIDNKAVDIYKFFA
jgi:hypothetical protein